MFDDDSADAAALWIDVASLGRRTPSLAKEADTVNTAWLEFLAEVVTAGTHTGDFHVTDPTITARRLLTIIDGLGAQSSTNALSSSKPSSDGKPSTPSVAAPVKAQALKGMAQDFAIHELGLSAPGA